MYLILLAALALGFTQPLTEMNTRNIKIIMFLGRRGTPIDYWWESQRKRDHYEDQDVGGWIILGWILERWDGVMWTGLVWLRIGTGGELL
jgi:hypothetical protein